MFAKIFNVLIILNKKTMRVLFISLLLFVSGNLFSKDLTDDIVSEIRSGNIKEISKYFNDHVDLKIIDKEDSYSKAQAREIIEDFFIKHPVKSFTVAHKSASNSGSSYTIGVLETTNGKFRIYFLLKNIGDKTMIQQFRIETENGNP